jgi:DNA polymerase-3 subunit alpha
MSPQKFEDVCAAIALYRPGPMSANMHYDYADRINGRQQITLFHEDAREILQDTYGLMIYQEQVMSVAQRFAGFSMAEADNLRKAMGKKIREEMEKWGETFVNGCVSNGYDRDFASSLFETINAFADYAFNKSHTYGYGIIAYQSAYLKANYPVEYMSALMTSVIGKHEKLAPYLTEASRMGISVKPPDINVSGTTFTPKADDEIVFGLVGIRNVGEVPALDIVETRGDTPFEDFFDFADRVSRASLNKKVIDSLVAAGSFESMGHARLGLKMVQEEIIKEYLKRKKDEEFGKLSLFSYDPPVKKEGIPDDHYDRDTIMAMEKEYLGVYVTDHPLNHIPDLDRHRSMMISDAVENENGLLTNKQVKLVGIVTKTQKKYTRAKGELMKIFQLEDTTGSIECVLFPQQTSQYGTLIDDGAIISAEGQLQDDRGSKILINGVRSFKKPVVLDSSVHIYLPNAEPIETIQQALKKVKGIGRIVIHYNDKALLLPEEYKGSFDNVVAALSNG